MKKLILYLCLLLCIAMPVYGAPSYHQGFARNAGESQSPNQWKGIVCSLRPSLGNTGIATLIDVSGRSNHGATDSTQADDWVIGGNPRLPGYNLDMDGFSNGDKIIVPDNASLRVENGSGATWMIWIKPAAADDATSFKEVLFDKQFGSNGGVFLYLESSTLRFFNGSVQTGTTTISNSIFYFIAVTKDGTSGQTYVNGIPDKSFTWAASPDSSGSDLGICADTTSTGRRYTGRMDDARVYNRTFSQSELFNVYQDPSAMFRLKRPVYKAPAPPVGGARRVTLISQYVNQVLSNLMLY